MAAYQLTHPPEVNLNPELIQLAKQLLQKPNDASSLNHSGLDSPQITRTLKKLLRAGHQIHFVTHGQDHYVFKVFADTGEHSHGRRLEFFIENAYKNLAKRSYQGALILKQLGLPAIEPLACITQGHPFNRKGVFIYRQVQAEHSLGQWLKQSRTPEQTQNVVKQLADITRRLEASNWHFSDFKLDNILVEENDKESRLVLIDTDDIIRSRIKHVAWLPKRLRNLIKLWHLRRLKPRPPLDELFLQAHLAQKDPREALALWRKLRTIQINPWKAIKQKRKRAKTFSYQGWQVTSAVTEKQAKDCLKQVAQHEYSLVTTYKDTQRSLSQHIITQDGQDLILKYPRAQYRGLTQRLLNLVRVTEAKHQHTSLCQLQQLGLAAPRPYLAAEKKSFGLPSQGLVIYHFAQGRPVNPEEEQDLKAVATALHQLHCHGLTRHDPRPNNFLIHDDQAVFIDCLLQRPRLFTRTRTRMEYIKLARRYPQVLNYLPEEEKNNRIFQLTLKLKNLGRDQRKARKKTKQRTKRPKS